MERQINGFQSHEFCFLLLGKMYFHSMNFNYSPIVCEVLCYNRYIIGYQDGSRMALVLKVLSSREYDNQDIQNSMKISTPII